MSRIGRMPIVLPANVTTNIDADNVVTVKGPLGTLTLKVDKSIIVRLEANIIHVERQDEVKLHKAMHGLYRKLISNMVEGVTKGFQKSLIVNGVGYKISKQGNKVIINCGYSHTVEVVEPNGITIDCIVASNEIVVKGIDRDLVGQTAANIKAIKKPDPYHIYGIRYKDEVIVKKEGKKTGKK